MEGTRTDPARGGSLRATFDALWSWRRFIVGVVAAFMVVTVALSLAMPRVFVARTSLLPPVSSNSGMMSLPGLEASLGLLGIQDESMSTAKLFRHILKSRSVMESVIRDQKLLDWYQLTSRPEALAMEEAIDVLRGDCDFVVSEAGIIEISVRMATGWLAGTGADEAARQKAAAVANSIITELDRINREKSLSRATSTRKYLEKVIAENETAIRTLSDEMAEFQRTHGAVALDFQTRALVETAAQLKGKLLAKQVELGIALQSMTPDNPVVGNLRREIAEMEQGLTGLEGDADANAEGGLDLSASTIPSLQSRMASYKREIEAQLQLSTFLGQQYYQAKVQEARDAPTVQVLDPAIPPAARFSPRRTLMLIGGTMSGFLVAILAAGAMHVAGVRNRR